MSEITEIVSSVEFEVSRVTTEVKGKFLKAVHLTMFSPIVIELDNKLSTEQIKVFRIHFLGRSIGHIIMVML